MFKKNNLIFILVFFYFKSHGSSNDVNFKKVELSVGTLKRNYLVFNPIKDNSSQKPLLIFFHGSKSNAKRQIDFTDLGTTATEKDFVLVLAETQNDQWNLAKENNPDFDYFDELLKQVQKNDKIDSQKIFAAGHSNGAQFVYRLLEKKATLFAGMAVFGANSFLHQNLKPYSPDRVKRFVFVHGEKDEIFNWENSLDEKSTKKGARDILIKAWRCSSSARKIVANGEQFDGCDQGAKIFSFLVPNMTHNEWPSAKSKKSPQGYTEDLNAIIWDLLNNKL